MVDQAAELRNLVLRASRQANNNGGESPRLAVMMGSKGGVGATTLAVNLSIALVEQKIRVVLVDADLHRGDIAHLCHLPKRHDIGDVLVGNRNLAEVLQAGPGGIRIVPGIWAPEQRVSIDGRSRQRLLTQMQQLGPDVDLVLLDIGNADTETVRHLWPAMHDAFWVTTSDAVAIMDCYATIKAAVGPQDAAYRAEPPVRPGPDRQAVLNTGFAEERQLALPQSRHDFPNGISSPVGDNADNSSVPRGDASRGSGEKADATDSGGPPASESQVVTSARRARMCPSEQRERCGTRGLSLVGCGPPALGLITNQIENEQDALDVHRRIDKSVQRFLGRRIADLGGVPVDRGMHQTATSVQPLIVAQPDAPAARAIRVIAARLAQEWSQQRSSPEPSAA